MSAGGARILGRMPTAASSRSTELGRALAVAAIAAGAGAVLLRPVAPPIGPVPPDSAWFDPATLARVAAYWSPLRPVLAVAAVVGALGPLGVIWAVRDRPRIRAFGDRVATWPVAARGAAVAAVVVALQQALLLGFRWWAGFVHAGSYGLSTQSWLGWLGDRAIDAGVAVVASGVVAGSVAAVVALVPRTWPLLAGAVVAVLAGVALVVWPLAVEPLRYDRTPLDAGPAHDAVTTTTAAAGWDDAPVVVADASRRTTRVNAYVSGLGATRSVVLYDTLLELPAEQIAAVVAHEIAHHLHADLLRGWLATTGAVAAVALATDVWWRRVVAREGTAAGAVRAVLGAPHRLAVVIAVVLALEAAAMPAVAWASRRVEASADATALELVDDPSGTIALHRSLVLRNLSDPSPPDWWQWWRGTHPPAAERLHRAEQLAQDSRRGAS